MPRMRSNGGWRGRPITYHDLGAHVSTAGGVTKAPARARELRSSVLQLFTKQPNRWAEPIIDDAIAAAFTAERKRCAIGVISAHDSYLINLASPDPVLHARSLASFEQELARCQALGVSCLVTHPGNATDGDAASGIARNADALAYALERSARTIVLLETTAGTGHSLGCTFEQLAALIDRVPAVNRERLGVCVDTCHVWAAGYDLRSQYEAVIQQMDDSFGLDRVMLFHVNDSTGGLGSRRDRHAHIGEGELGDGPFRALLADDRFRNVPKLLETPKDDDALRADRRNLNRLRRLRREALGA